MSNNTNKNFLSIWSPLKVFNFRIFWAGMSLSTIAFWMQNIIATSLMISWTNGDALMLSFVQTALFLPAMVLSLPFGILADIIDRRKFLIFSQLWMMLPPILISVLVFTKLESPILLLLATAMLSIGNAMKLPCQSAFLVSLTEKKLMSYSIALNSMSVNGGRVIGPAMAGFLLPILGPSSLLAANSLVYFIYIIILIRLHSKLKKIKLSQPELLKKVSEIINYTSQTKTYKMILLRGGLYFCTWSTILGVIPLILEDPKDFGFLYGLFGTGAVLGASLYGILSNLFSKTTGINIGICLHGLILYFLSSTEIFFILGLMMLLMGVTSFFIMTSLQVSAQIKFPDEIRGRGLALITTVFMGATALSSPFWGYLTNFLSPHTTLKLASLFAIFFALTLSRNKIS
jgi:MFS family permease